MFTPELTSCPPSYDAYAQPILLGLAFKVIEEAEKTRRPANGPEKVNLLREGVAFKDGEPVQDDQPVQHSAWTRTNRYSGRLRRSDQ